MKQILNQIFVTLGVIFLIVIIIAIYFFVADPYKLKPLIFGSSAPVPSKSANETQTENKVAASGFQLSEAQKQALISFGIDPTTVPTSISVEQENCFVSVLGEARVGEIKSGAVPSAFEFLKAKACI